MSKLRTLFTWIREFKGLSSICNGYRLLRAGASDPSRRAVLRQVTPRGLPFPLHCREGTTDFLTVMELFILGEYERAKAVVPEPVRWVLDFGGNVGIATSYFFRQWPGARFILIEPDESNFAMAAKTLSQLVKEDRVHMHKCFIGGTSRFALLDTPQSQHLNSLRLGKTVDDAATKSAGAIAVMTVPQLLQQHNVDFVDLLKCDIEGAESELFADCAVWIRSIRHLVVELHDELSPQWLEQAIRNGGGDFTIIESTANGSGTSLVWMSNRNPTAFTTPST